MATSGFSSGKSAAEWNVFVIFVMAWCWCNATESKPHNVGSNFIAESKIILMRNIIIILIILFFSNKNFGQHKYDYKQGYKFIKKAERKLEQGNLIKSEEFLKKARISDYGFCGNAWASAEGQINLIQAQIYNKRENFDKALTILDSINGCGFGADCEARDSLKVLTLILKYGKEKVKEAFSNVTKLEKVENDFNTFYSVYLKELNYTFTFNNTEYYIVGTDGKKIVQEKLQNEFLNKIRNHNYYKLIE